MTDHDNTLATPGQSTLAGSTAATVEAQPRHTGTLAWIALLVALMFLAMIQHIRSLQLRPTTTQILAPGLTLTKTVLNTPGGEIPEYIVRAQRKDGWKFQLLPADFSVLKRFPVSQIAANYNTLHKTATNAFPAPVAVNGGFFAYEGAPVGAVKIDGEWIRLPWKNRTAIGWTSDNRIKIASLSGKAIANFGAATVEAVNLNGRPSATAITPLTNHFADSYQLRPSELAVQIRDGQVTGKAVQGKVLLEPGPGSFTLIAGAKAPIASRQILDSLTEGTPATLKIETSPIEWNDYPTILGAGPRLIENDTIKITHVEEEFRPDVLARGPRTTLGVDRDGNLIILVIEAWHDKIRGMTLEAVAAELQRAGAVEGINLDGGSSTTLVVNNKPLTHLSDLVIDSHIIEPASERREVGVANAVVLTR